MKKVVNLFLSGLLVLGFININRNVVKAESSTQTSSPVQEFELNHYDVASSKLNFDGNWKFFLGEAQGAENPTFQDLTWKNVDLPHDYSLSQNYSTNGEAESGYKLGGVGWYRKQFTLGPAYEGKKVYLHFDGAYMLAEVYVNGQKAAFHPYGYTAFKVDITDYVKTDGTNLIAVKTNNPVPTSRWYSGSGLYRSVYLETSDKIHFASYGVKLTTPDLSASHLTDVTLRVDTNVVNESPETKSDLKVKVKLYNGSEMVGEANSETLATVNTNESTTNTVNLIVANPTLWDVTNPHLYKVVVELLAGDTVVDTYEKEYGFRFFNFDRETGFSLNGKNLKLKGVSMHHDQGALGAAAYYDAIERQVIILKEMGVNSIRVTHNPSARHLKDAANRHGILLIEEAFDTWSNRKNGNYNDYAKWFKTPVGEPMKLVGANSEQTWAEFDVKQMTREGLNDPSIIMWSIGNEIFEGLNTWNTSDYPQIATNLAKWIDSVDGTRYVTFGDNKLKGEDGRAIAVANALANKEGVLKGIVGYNYAVGSQYQSGYNAHLNWIIYGSETASSVNSRGTYTYTIDSRSGQYNTPGKDLSSYDQRTVPWGHTAKHAWYDVITRDYVAGEYVWTGFDYLGEPTPWNNTGRGATGGWPSPKSSYFGIIDTAGFPKDSFYFYQSQWNDDVKTLHILPQWKEGQVTEINGNVRVVVYSDAKAVELFRLTPDGTRGESLGRKEFTKVETTAGHTYQYHGSNNLKGLELVWNVPYRAGGLEAVAYGDDGQVISVTKGNNKVQNYGNAAKLVASANKQTIDAKKQSLIYVEIDVQDSNNIFVANADNTIQVSVEGPGKLVGLDNGRQVDHQSYQDTNRKAFAGKLLAIVESTGKAGQITVTATSQGLASTSVQVNAVEKVEEAMDNPIVKVAYSPIVYIKKATELTLPETIQAIRADKSEESLSVEWNRPENLDVLLESPGTFTVTGKAEGLGVPISVNIVVLDKVAALLNYATATLVGQEVTLPESRPAVDSEGNVLDISFPVDWDSVDSSKYTSENTFTVNGRAVVFGDELTVTATIRVAQASITQGGNVASAAILSEDATENQKSDTLSAIIDGNKTYRVNNANTNPYAWSNYKLAQAGIDNATISFTFDTAQNINKAVIYYFTDTWATVLPREVQFSYNLGNGDDIAINATASSPLPANGLQKITYTFDKPVPAVILKTKFLNGLNSPRQNTKATTGVYEVELLTATQNLEKGRVATLDTLTINDKEISSSVLSTKNINTEALIAETTQTATANGAITVLPAYNNKVVILVESEDQTNVSKYTIHLGQEETTAPDDGSRDLPHDKVRLEAGSEESRGSNRVTNANDGDPNSIWHSRWAGETLDKLYAIVEVLEDGAQVEALRYLPRPGSGDGDDNGRVKSFKIYSSNDKSEWTEVTSGTWENNAEWKVSEFPQPVVAKYFKLQAVETYGNRRNAYMSAAEISLRIPKQKTSIADAVITVEPTVYEYTGQAVRPQFGVKLNEKTLREGVDYTFTLENNVEASNSAIIRVKGIVDYSGEVTKEFTISKRDIMVTEGSDLGFTFSKTNLLDDYYVKVTELQLTDSRLETSKEEIENLGVVRILNLALHSSSDDQEVVSANHTVNVKHVLSDDYKGLGNVKVHRLTADRNLEEVFFETNETKTILTFETTDFGIYVVSSITDKTALSESITIAEEEVAKDGIYTEESLAALQEALDEAKEIVERKNATVAEVSAAKQKLDQKRSELRYLVEDGNLEELIRVSEERISKGDLKPSSVQELQTAIDAAKAYLNGEQTSPEQTINQYNSLRTVLDSVKTKADRSALDAAISNFNHLSSDNYKKSSYDNAKTLIDEISEKVNDETEQSTINNLLNELKAIVDGLIPRAKVDSLDSLLKTAKEANLNDKTKESISALKTAIKEAEAKLADDDWKADALQSEVDAVKERLQSALNNLVTRVISEKIVPSGNLTIRAKGTFDETALELSIRKLAIEEITNVHTDAASTTIENIEVYEATVVGEYEDNTVFTLTVPRDLSRNLVQIIHISKKGIERLNKDDITANFINIKASDLSPFILVYEPKVLVQPTNPNPVNPAQTTSSVVSTTEEKSVLPRTGTGVQTTSYVVVDGLLLASAYFLLRSRKED